MRYLPLALLLLLPAACAGLDTRPGASGVPDTPLGRPDLRTGEITTGGQVIMDRDRPPR
ncbi:MAG: hypothetical protein JWR10_2755 [Rubritepida sp.]|nr:hypothetical protein [Rubritepida sp.]